MPTSTSAEPGSAINEPAPEEPRVARFVPLAAADLLGTLRRRAGVFLLTVSAALVLVIPLLFVAGSNPVEAYGALLNGSLGGKRQIGEFLVATTPLLVTGLAVALAFQGGLFNIGAEGQLVVGGLAAGVVGAEVALPAGLHVCVALAAGALAGGLWALLPAVLKAWRGVHEVITTLMMNFVAFNLSLWLVSPGGLVVSDTQPSATELVAPTAELPTIWPPTRLHAGILLALALAGGAWYYLYRTPAGYEIRTVGSNPTAARFNGISVRRVILRTLVISGGLAGLAGAVEVLGLHRRYFDSFSPGFGFDSIAVALLGLLHPLGVILAAAFFGLLRAGATRLQSDAGLSKDVITVVSGLVVTTIAASVVVERHWKRLTAERNRRVDAQRKAEANGA